MCSGQLNAAAATHATIVATLILPTGVGPVMISTPTPSLATAPSNPTMALSTPAAATSLSSEPAANQAPSPSPTVQSNQQSLNTGQIAGIAVGIAVVVLLLIAILLYAVCTRRKKYLNAAGGFSQMHDSWSFGRKSESSPHMLQISAPIHLAPPDLDFTRPLAPRASFRPDAIGLALSPAGAAVAPLHSRVQPSTPNAPQSQSQVPVDVPQQARLASSPRQLRAQSIKSPRNFSQRIPRQRESIVTEFAEDDDGDMGMGVAPQSWRPPQTGAQSTAPHYVADESGTQVHGDPGQQPTGQLAESNSPNRAIY